MVSKRLVCDYLVVGSGAASLAFIDTLLTELPQAKVVLVDRRARPGGHWVDDYDFVRLHQPSILYGLASRQLEGNWLKLLLGRFQLPWRHRATKAEILAHFSEFVDDKVASGQVVYFPGCSYDFGGKGNSSGEHHFASLDGKLQYAVKVKDKLVDGVRGECKIPSLCPPEFPVDDGVPLVTPNQMHDMHRESSGAAKTKHFVVLGCGKTAMDAIVFLQSEMGINPDRISWVIPNDVWMLYRDGKGDGGPWSYPRALLKAGGDINAACASMESRGELIRVDETIKPTRVRFPVVGRSEIVLMRKIKDTVRRGRVSSISLGSNRDILVGFGPGERDWVLPAPADGHVFVHCTSPGPFNGYPGSGELFSSDQIELGLLFAPPISMSMSCLARLESARKKGTLDVAFGRELIREMSVDCGSDASDDEVLLRLIRGIPVDDQSVTHIDHPDSDITVMVEPIITLGLFLAIVDPDPMVGYNWMKSNRLSFLSIPGFKSGLLEDLDAIVEKGKVLGYPAGKLRMIKKMAEKLEPLRGK